MSGIPYSLAEAKLVASQHPMDEYHRELMKWLIGELERHRANGPCPPGFFCTHDLLCKGAVR